MKSNFQLKKDLTNSFSNFVNKKQEDQQSIAITDYGSRIQ
jgi:hypothetical protein